MANEKQLPITDARPFLRFGSEKAFMKNANSDSGSCSGASDNSDSGACSSESCACGTGGGECGHIPAKPKLGI